MMSVVRHQAHPPAPVRLLCLVDLFRWHGNGKIFVLSYNFSLSIILRNFVTGHLKKKFSNNPGIAGWGVEETALFALSLEITNHVVRRVLVCRKHVS